MKFNGWTGYNQWVASTTKVPTQDTLDLFQADDCREDAELDSCRHGVAYENACFHCGREAVDGE